MDPIALSIFASRIEAVCDEMGAVLQRAAFSPNIRDRLDFSCAVFDARGELCAQAAHIPVHLGSMAYAMHDIVSRLEWAPGDQVIVNDPFLGGTHLPDVTVIAPLFVDDILVAFVANRAHHADIGAHSPGSMPISRSLAEEGLIIPPTHLVRAGQRDEEMLGRIVEATRNPDEGRGDFAAQLSANRSGLERLGQLVADFGRAEFARALAGLNDYAERLALDALGVIPDGVYRFEDVMDDDGLGHRDLVIAAEVRAAGGRVHVDFAGTAAQTPGNINCPLSVAAAGVYYVFRCLMPPQTPACAGAFRPITLEAPEGCLLNARRPAAVAAGNVETSTRVVDVVMGALARALPETIPAASHGSMNNLAMGASAETGGGRAWDYYETVGGGMGAGAHGGGLHGVQTHMTNTRNTPVEVLEARYPVRVRRYALRRGSGGAGQHPGGDGVVREYEFLAPAQATLLTERRTHAPWGLAGGAPGSRGENRLNGEALAVNYSLPVAPGDRLSILTPGGGGWGSPDTSGRRQ
ncbi:MAG: hydantoinase B/oxoprolinase family protein [Gammaproteobacteria bacterium]